MPQRDPFKMYDARWEIHEFDDAGVIRLFEATFAYGRRLNVDTITLARDGRLAAAHVLELGIDTAVRMGFRTIVCPDPISTPQAYFLALHTSREFPRTMGLMITASHNPRQYIGVKFTVPMVQAVGMDCGPMGGLTAIRSLYHCPEEFGRVAGGSLSLVNLNREYIDYSMRLANVGPGSLSDLAVVLDGLHGSAGPELMTALQIAGARVEPLRLIPNGHFPTGSPNPTSIGKMERAMAIAAERDCAVVLGLDGDGDRIVFGDRRGIFSAGFAAIPILRACVEANSSEGGRSPLAPVLYDLKVNPQALAEWGKLGIRPMLFRNGHSQIKHFMRQINALAAAEESGHYYHRISLEGLTAWCENTLFTALLFLRAAYDEPGLLHELWDLQTSVKTAGEFNYQFADNTARDQAIRAAVDQFIHDGAAVVSHSPDGTDLHGMVISKGVAVSETGVNLDSGWYSGHLRMATNEKSVARAYFSAADPDRIEQIMATIRHIFAHKFKGALIE